MSIVKKITIHDVALAAGVSVTTVSLVLSGKGRISARTGQRVHDAIEELGFVRNRQASALRGGQTGVIGLIVCDLALTFYAEATSGLSEALESEGRMVFLLHGGRDGEHLLARLNTLLTQGVDGVIVAGIPGEQGAAMRACAQEAGVPLIFASRSNYPDDADTVRPDNTLAAQRVTEHLIQQGHQRIAWLGGESASLIRAERVGGYCATLLKYGLPFNSDWVVECDASQKQAAEAVQQLLSRNPTLDAIVCYNGPTAMGAWFGLLRAGWQAGSGLDRYFEQQVSLAAFADAWEQGQYDIPVAWATLSGREMGYLLAERILQRIDEPERTLHQAVLTPGLVVNR
ncbi:Mal regulon transcriptional regulator MalI [Yokenella regensburgei]|uniref:Mal regulon transcriptional regulator MalI n=1 Tax=Yokenella regensburgei TaxID=158877 RepID=UPI003F15C91A